MIERYTVLYASCLTKNTEHRDSRGEVWGRADRMKEAGPRQRTEVSAKMNAPKKKKKTTSKHRLWNC